MLCADELRRPSDRLIVEMSTHWVGRLLLLLVFAGACTASGVDAPLSTVGPQTTTSVTQALLPTTASSSSTVPTEATVTTQSVSLPAEGPIFDDKTGMLLLFDDGLDGVTAVDPDRRLAGRSVVEGQRAGDEPFSMIRVGDSLVVGWSDIYAVNLASREPTSLGPATIFVPAAEPERVWMIDYPGGRIGSGQPRVWQVNVSGEQITEPVTLLADGYPAMGVIGGLVLQLGNGLDLWNSSTGKVTPLEEGLPGFVSEVQGVSLVWCAGECSSLIVTDTSTLASQEFDPPEGYARFVGQYFARFSPDGRYLAAMVGGPGPSEGEALWIVDLHSGSGPVVSDPDTTIDYLAWAPDGTQLFASAYSYSQTHTAIWRYQLSDPDLTAVVLPFGGALTPVVADHDLAGVYIGNQPSSDTCPAPRGQTSGICTFSF